MIRLASLSLARFAAARRRQGQQWPRCPDLARPHGLASRHGGPSPHRDIQEFFPAKGRPAYTTVQTTVYRLETKKALRRTRKIATALIFEAAISREAAQRRLIDDLLGLFGGRSRPIMAHLVESGTLTLDDVRAAEQALLTQAKKNRA